MFCPSQLPVSPLSTSMNITAGPITKNSTMKVPNDDPPAYTDPANPPDYPPPPGIAHPFFHGCQRYALADADRALAWCQRYCAPRRRCTSARSNYGWSPRPSSRCCSGTRTSTARSGFWTRGPTPAAADGAAGVQGCAGPGRAAVILRARAPPARGRGREDLLRGAHRPPRRRGPSQDDKAAAKPHHHPWAASSTAPTARPREAEQSGAALGFVAPPYPPFRLPGWQRGSLAVHSDDGRRYVANENWRRRLRRAVSRQGRPSASASMFRAAPAAPYAAGGRCGAGPRGAGHLHARGARRGRVGFGAGHGRWGGAD